MVSRFDVAAAVRLKSGGASLIPVLGALTSLLLALYAAQATAQAKEIEGGRPLVSVEDLHAGRASSGSPVPEVVAQSDVYGSRRLAQYARSRRRRDGGPADQVSASRVSDADGHNRKAVELHEIVVTGTHISGVKPVTPVVTITSEEIRNSGLPDIASVIRALPENYSGGQNPGAVVGGGVNGGDTFFLPSSANLRGLGSNATLTLLDGHRIAGSGSEAYVDLSSIPTAAVKRVEIETGGDSAIYGADAVAGVVNVILRKSYDGERTDAYIGSTTDGGLTQRYSQLFGRSIRNGSAGLMLGYQYQSVDQILAGQRTVSRRAGNATAIQPQQLSHAIFLSANARIIPGLTGSVEGVYNHRASLDLWDGLANQDRENQFDLNGDLTVKAGSTGTVSLSMTWSGDSAFGLDYQPLARLLQPRDQQSVRNRLLEIALSGQGIVTELPGGRVLRAAIGVGVTQQTLDAGFPAGTQTPIAAGRHKQHAYLEINVPIVPAALGRTGLERCDLNAAGRFEHYDDFGSIAVPKLGLLYQPFRDVELSGSWGRSYQPPSLYDLYGGETLIREPGAYFIGVPSGKSVLLLAGSNVNLRPQTAVTRTISLQWKPHERGLRGITASASYYDIDFASGINSPITNFTEAVSNPAFAPYVVYQPSAALQTELASSVAQNLNPFGLPIDPASVQALVLDTRQNVSRQTVHGVDGSLAYLRETAVGELMIKATASWESFDQIAIPGMPTTEITGTIFNPPKFKARAVFGWERRGWGLNLFVNHIAGEDNTASVPVTRISSWTTVDGQLRYVMHAVRISASVLNLMNTPPPAIAASTAVIPPGIGFDADNYSAVGRFVSLQATVDW